MIRCLAIDDEPLALKQLASYISRVPYFELVATCSSAIVAREVLEKEKVDALFVDINMPDLNGLDFVRSLESKPITVFTTAYSEYAVDGYKVNAVDYLLKPFGMSEFKASAERVKKQYDLENSSEVSAVDDDNSIFIKSDYKVMRVNVDDILYVEAMSEYLRIYIEGATKAVVVLLSMKKMVEHLDSNKFMRVHRSYIINLRKIKEVTRTNIILIGGASIPIGEMYKEQFNNYILSKFLTK